MKICSFLPKSKYYLRISFAFNPVLMFSESTGIVHVTGPRGRIHDRFNTSCSPVHSWNKTSCPWPSTRMFTPAPAGQPATFACNGKRRRRRRRRRRKKNNEGSSTERGLWRGFDPRGHICAGLTVPGTLAPECTISHNPESSSFTHKGPWKSLHSIP